MKIGDTFIIQFEIVAEVQTGEQYQGMTLDNSFCNKFWASPVGQPDGPRMICCFDHDHQKTGYDPFIQSIEELNRNRP